jgi:uncharacterized membrane-anchored protein
MRNVVLWGVAAIVLGIANWAIVGKERVLADGETVLLELAPRDPRSLLQGDYIVLRYTLARQILAELSGDRFSRDGVAVVRLDSEGVGRFVRIDGDGAQLGPDERLVRFRKRGELLRLAGEAFFFEEGQQDLYAGARYGELRVDAGGEAVLVGVRDADRNRLGPEAGTASE